MTLPRFYIRPEYNRPGWQIISRYQEEEVVEGTFDTEAAARALVQSTREFRADQTEAPCVRVEHVE